MQKRLEIEPKGLENVGKRERLNFEEGFDFWYQEKISNRKGHYESNTKNIWKVCKPSWNASMEKIASQMKDDTDDRHNEESVDSVSILSPAVLLN